MFLTSETFLKSLKPIIAWLKYIRLSHSSTSRVQSVANKQRKTSAKGMAARAAALARKIREQSKNLSKKKGLRRIVDTVLTDSNIMAVVPYGGAVSKTYKSVKNAMKKTNGTTPGTVSPCLKKWFTCLTTPFQQEAQGACIPSGGNISSMRSMNFVRGNVVIGQQGVGYLQLIPTPWNDVVCAVTTAANFNGTTAAIFVNGGTSAWVNGMQPLSFANGRFSTAAVSAAAQAQNPPVACRIVGGGLKCYYVGTELNRGGLMNVYTSPTHFVVNSLPTNPAIFMTPSLLGAYQETIIRPISREPFEYPLGPLLEQELNYAPSFDDSVSTTDYLQRLSYPWSPTYLFNGLTSTTNQGNPLIFLGQPTTIFTFTGQPGNVIHFEYALHVESTGDQTEGQRLPADSDPVGVDSMMAALSRAAISRNSYPNDTAAQVLRREMKAVQAGRDARVVL